MMTPRKPPSKRNKLPAREAKIYQLKITLYGTKPPIWRRILVPANVPLPVLSEIIQLVMDWHGGHLHEFFADGQHYTTPDPIAKLDGLDDLEDLDETRYQLDQLLTRPYQEMEYIYDFGDSWEHTILLEKILEPDADHSKPLVRCLAGRLMAPPDDCGGVYGYYDLIEAIRDPQHPEHEILVDWYGAETIDPKAFDLGKTNLVLEQIGW